jgi:hypothetical protein
VVELTAGEQEARLPGSRAREARVQSLLGCPRIPEGYHASLAISIPFLMDMVILGDREPVFGKDSRLFEKRGFVYVKMLRRGKSGASVQDFFDGKARVEQLIPGAGVEISEGEEIVRGTLARSDVSIRYLSRRGTIKTRGQSMSGITTFLVFECPGDARSRVGIWFGPEAAPDKGDDPSTGRTGAPGGAPPLAGTPADENAIREFTSHFSPCAS